MGQHGARSALRGTPQGQHRARGAASQGGPRGWRAVPAAPQIAKGCTPDFVLPSRHIAVFVDGCFWHGCPEHGRKTPWAGPNAELWADKMRRNAERDRRSTHLAQDHGWQVVRVWECQVRRDPGAVAHAVMSTQEPDQGRGFHSLSDPLDGVPPAR